MKRATLLCCLGLSTSLTPLAAMADSLDDLRLKSEIKEKLIYAYADAWDRKDCTAWSRLFTADGLLDLSGDGNLASTVKRATGRQEIQQFCETRMKTALVDVKPRHFMTNTIFRELTHSRAAAETYAFVTWQKPTDPAPVVKGSITYRDVIVKENGRWLLKERYVQ